MPTATAAAPATSQDIPLHLKVLGRTLEHFGVQMYKQRPAAIAELVANCWDAGAKNASVSIPPASAWSNGTGQIAIRDDGCGMTAKTVQDAYLVLGRNRREAEGKIDSQGRRVMGRKGIGKLAGFGIANEMTVRTWRDGAGTEFTLRLNELRAPDTEMRDVLIVGKSFTPLKSDGAAGTEVLLRGLRNKTPLAPDTLRQSLARRFSRVVKGEMEIKVEGASLPDPIAAYDVIHRFPEQYPAELSEQKLPSGNIVRFGYAYTQKTIKDSEMAGFAVLVHGKTAQAPPFFFRIENTASGQHATKYVSGVIEADYLDDATDSRSDVISTDRQEIDWNHAACNELREWGERLTRHCLSECTEIRGKRKADELALDNSVKERLLRLDKGAQKQVHRLIGSISYTDPDDERALQLVDSILKVFEFRHFHDMVEDMENVAHNPEMLAAKLDVVREWKLLESRAIFEVIQGRIAVIDMFESALAADAPETAHTVGQSNLHDAVGRFPWLLNPDYNVFAEEKTLTKLLYQLAQKDSIDVEKERIDFCAIADDGRVIVIEIKRSGHAVRFDEIQRLDRYMETIAGTTERQVSGILVFGGSLNVSANQKKALAKREDLELRPWSRLFDSTKKRYERYRAILEGEIDHRDFKAAEGEVAQIRSVVQNDSFYRNKSDRKKGLGSQDK
jgi:RecB family endonuclease NucS